MEISESKNTSGKGVFQGSVFVLTPGWSSDHLEFIKYEFNGLAAGLLSQYHPHWDQEGFWKFSRCCCWLFRFKKLALGLLLNSWFAGMATLMGLDTFGDRLMELKCFKTCCWHWAFLGPSLIIIHLPSCSPIWDQVLLASVPGFRQDVDLVYRYRKFESDLTVFYLAYSNGTKWKRLIF
jgi:hypothetical protein